MSESEFTKIIQPCSEGCTCFRRLPAEGWSDYGLCMNPQSPLHGFPTPIDHECPYYRADQRPLTPEHGSINRANPSASPLG